MSGAASGPGSGAEYPRQDRRGRWWWSGVGEGEVEGEGAGEGEGRVGTAVAPGVIAQAAARRRMDALKPNTTHLPVHGDNRVARTRFCTVAQLRVASRRG